MRFFRRFCAAFLVAASVAACTADAPAPEGGDQAMVQAEESMQPRDLVDLTIYYRKHRGGDRHLEPVLREVPVNDDLPRTALGLLLDGPTRDDPPGLRPPLPTTTRVTKFSVAKGEARVELSRAAATDAERVGKSAENEVLALAAVANTLTEFPDIRRVRLRIKGQPQRRFWGGWGIPDVLVRDESLISDSRRTAIPPPDEFGGRSERMGVEQRRRPSPAVAAVRVQSLTTYLRVTVEVTSAKGGPLKGPVPPTTARRSGRSGRNVVLRVRGNPSKEVTGSLASQPRDPALRRARVEVKDRPGEVVVRLRSQRRARFLLHALSEPARVVLDIRR